MAKKEKSTNWRKYRSEVKKMMSLSLVEEFEAQISAAWRRVFRINTVSQSLINANLKMGIIKAEIVRRLEAARVTKTAKK